MQGAEAGLPDPLTGFEPSSVEVHAVALGNSAKSQ